MDLFLLCHSQTALILEDNQVCVHPVPDEHSPVGRVSGTNDNTGTISLILNCP